MGMSCDYVARKMQHQQYDTASRLIREEDV